MSTHEHWRSAQEIAPGSDRSFGFVFAIAFGAIGLWPLLWRGDQPRFWAIGIAALCLASALWLPQTLAPLNRLWFRFGLLLHRVVNPLVMGLVYYATVVPVGVIMRLWGKDPLRTKIDVAAPTYWIVRKPPGPTPESMTKQF